MIEQPSTSDSGTTAKRAQSGVRGHHPRDWPQARARTFQLRDYLKVSVIRDAAHFLAVSGAASGSLYAIGHQAVCDWFADLRASRI